MFFSMHINLHKKQIDGYIRTTAILLFSFLNQINITNIRLLKFLEIIESLHCIIDHLTNIRTKWYQPKIFKSIFFIMCIDRNE